MDLLKEIRDVKTAIQDALEDGHVTFTEGLKIAREALDVVALLLPLIQGQTVRAEVQDQSQKD